MLNPVIFVVCNLRQNTNFFMYLKKKGVFDIIELMQLKIYAHLVKKSAFQFSHTHLHLQAHNK